MSDTYPIDMAALVDFVNARADDDEHWAVESASPDYSDGEEGTPAHSARILREVAAKRSHVVRWQKVDDLLPGSDGEIHRSLLSVRRAYALVILDDATVYADHPDYRSEWKPRTTDA